ncbi:hypothetical protein [Cohnella sp.]|uniref:hypothetical protein n=1 Tax=Cohnella sp. TaxID=1883426 RepID=UPI00356214E8
MISVISSNVSRIHEPENLKLHRGGRDAVRFAGLSAWIHFIDMPRADPEAERLRNVNTVFI